MSADACRVDLHVKVLDETVVARARAAGLDAIVYAPHFTRITQARTAAARYSTDDLLVVPAREIFTGTWRDRRHILAIGLTDPIPDFITLEAAMAELERQDAAVLAPHPEFTTVSLTEADLHTYADQIHATEVFNPKHLGYQNRRAERLAEAIDSPPFASSYAHLRRTVGAAHTTLQTAVTDEADLVGALQSGVERTIRQPDGLERVSTSLPEMAHLFWENSWKKADRLFLSGTESTHPEHLAYDGQFDDVAVY